MGAPDRLELEPIDEPDDELPSHRQCVDCAALAPSTRTAHTLISAKHGWRLERIANADGTHQFDWRCPKCWHLHRQKGART